MKRIPVKFYLTEEEQERLVQLAGDVPISAFVRKWVLMATSEVPHGNKDNHNSDVRRVPDMGSDRRSPNRVERAPVSNPPSPKVPRVKSKKVVGETRCKHGFIVVDGVTACQTCKGEL